MAKTIAGTTALMAASEYGHCDTVQILLSKGADFDAASEGGLTALILASLNGHSRTVLMQAGAEPQV